MLGMRGIHWLSAGMTSAAPVAPSGGESVYSACTECARAVPVVAHTPLGFLFPVLVLHWTPFTARP